MRPSLSSPDPEYLYNISWAAWLYSIRWIRSCCLLETYNLPLNILTPMSLYPHLRFTTSQFILDHRYITGKHRSQMITEAQMISRNVSSNTGTGRRWRTSSWFFLLYQPSSRTWFLDQCSLLPLVHHIHYTIYKIILIQRLKGFMGFINKFATLLSKNCLFGW